MYQTILSETKDGYGVITLNRPDKLNALNNRLLFELGEAITHFQQDDAVHAIIITGSGAKAFAAGADIAELHEQNAETGSTFSEHGQVVFNLIEYSKKLVVAAVNGFALGGGCELALACHVRFAAENAKFGQPEVNLGIIPGYGGTQRLTRLVGRAKSVELILSGNIIGAQEAEKIGLVNAVHPLESLMNVSEQFVKTVIAKSQPAVRAALRCILAVDELEPMEGIRYESKKFGEICGTEDFKEGTQAFLEKRVPNFVHK